MPVEQSRISRRQIIAATGAMGLTAVTPSLVQAAAPLLGPSQAVFRRISLGDFEITTIFDGASQFDQPFPFFGGNASEEEVHALAAANLLPTDSITVGFTPTLVNTGRELVLFDTGYGAATGPDTGKLRERLQAAGFSPEQVDVVVITHFHPDHIGGTIEDGSPVFSNARYVTTAQEYDFWTNSDLASNDGLSGIHQLANAQMVPVVEKMTFVNDGEDVVSGITAVAAFGHTPGHTVYHIESNGQRLMITSDTANHYVLALQRPDWHFSFDVDKDAAAASRKKVFGMIAADKIPFIGYHMPFPSIGFVEKMGQGFRYMPLSYQLD